MLQITMNMMSMDIKTRCAWCEKDDLYREYHDFEWGIPMYDDAKLFENLILETFQAGLNWHTILKKREGFRTVFDNFDYKKIANYSESKQAKLLENASIIRNKSKIKATISNAIAFMKVQEEFGSYSNYFWKFANNKPIDNKPNSSENIPATTELSDVISKDLKKRGFKFIGSTTIYAHMQATGMINDHVMTCFTRKKIK